MKIVNFLQLLFTDRGLMGARQAQKKKARRNGAP